jgi:hypothetical protein
MSKERGAKIYELLLHIVAIISLLLAYDCSTQTGFIEYTKIWWSWLILTYISVRRLYLLDLLKQEARTRGILLTELTEELQKEKHNNDDFS